MARGIRMSIVGSLSTVPNGKTVLPVNDIDLLLQCAGIKGSTITTLAELFADTTTLQAVINSNNAIDYLVRSTEFAKQNALVPTMTSNTTPSGVASSSTYYNQREPYKAFDGNTAYPNYWATSSGKGWVQYQFTTSKVLKCVKLLQQVSGTSGWTMEDSSVKVQGSNDGTNFTDIEEITLLSSEATSWKTTSINNSTAYTYIRLDFNAPNMLVSGARYSVVGEVQFYDTAEAGFTENATAMTLIGANNYASDTLLGNNTWLNAICNSTYIDSVLNVKVPTMTSNTSPSGTCSGVGLYNAGTYPAYYAFDNNSSTFTALSISPAYYLQYEFPASHKMYCMVIKPRWVSSDNKLALKDFELVGSEDNVTWNTLATDSLTNQNIASKTYTFNGTDAQYLKLTNMTSHYTLVDINDVQYYGRVDV